MISDLPPNAEHYKETHDAPRVAEGWQRLFPVFATRTDNGWEVEIWWGRLVLSLSLFVALGWAAMTGGGYLFLKRQRGFTTVRYADTLLCFLPARWTALQKSYGEFLIKRAQQKVTEGELRAALFDLTIGTAKSPGNAEGRVLLARFYTQLRQPARAWSVLREGLEANGENLDYLRTVFAFLGQQQMDEDVMVVARSLLPKTPAITPRNQMIAFAQAQACFYRGNYDEAEDLLRIYQLDRVRDGLMLTVHIEWDRGEHELALYHLRQLATQLPDDAEIYRQTITWLRELGREDEARNASRVRKITDRANPYPRIDLLHSLSKDGEVAALRAGIEEIFRDFPNDSSALLALADFAANTGDVALARRVYLYCKEDPSGRLAWDYPALMVVEALIVTKDYQGAIDTANQLLAANPEWNKRYATVFSGLRAIATFGKGDTASGRAILAGFLSQPGIRADNFIVVSRRLIEVGARTDAHRVLTQAVKADPLNQPALSALLRLDLELNRPDDLATGLARLLSMRKPNPELLQSAYDKLGSDLFLFRADRSELLQKVRTALDTAKGRNALPRPTA